MIALAVAVFALVVREVWQAFRARQERRARDRALLSALLRELTAVAGITQSVGRDINKEREMIATQERWRLKPLVRFPTTFYEIVKSEIPAALLQQEGAVRTLLTLQVQCEYSNALAAEYQKWKTPEARGQPDQLETILSFHEGIIESANTVAKHCNVVIPLVHAAGELVGGLNLEGPVEHPAALERTPDL
jgi:hypothetical protein